LKKKLNSKLKCLNAKNPLQNVYLKVKNYIKNSLITVQLSVKNFPRIVKLDIPFRRFIYQVRKQLTLSKHTALFFFINNTIPPINSLFSTLYATHKENDGFLYITYTTENVFG